jgi:hypothetical protein
MGPDYQEREWNKIMTTAVRCNIRGATAAPALREAVQRFAENGRPERATQASAGSFSSLEHGAMFAQIAAAVGGVVDKATQVWIDFNAEGGPAFKGLVSTVHGAATAAQATFGVTVDKASRRVKQVHSDEVIGGLATRNAAAIGKKLCRSPIGRALGDEGRSIGETAAFLYGRTFDVTRQTKREKAAGIAYTAGDVGGDAVDQKFQQHALTHAWRLAKAEIVKRRRLTSNDIILENLRSRGDEGEETGVYTPEEKARATKLLAEHGGNAATAAATYRRAAAKKRRCQEKGE